MMQWILFLGIVFALLALDLGVFNRKTKVTPVKVALGWTAGWVFLALLFSLAIYQGVVGGYAEGVRTEKWVEFITGYLIELSLSVDNLFVFTLIFGYFKVPKQYQHRILFWGILGALVMRGAMIGIGTALISQFTWVIYLFGVFLVYTGIKMVFDKDEAEIDPEHNPLIKWFTRHFPVSHRLREEKFWFRDPETLKLVFTPLFVVLLCVEITDLIFAVDSIPAIFAVTTDPFIVFTSNVFAILGLRSLYFALAGIMHLFCYLKIGLGIVLAFVGVKMLLGHTDYKISTEWSLAVVGLVLAASVALSIVKGRCSPPNS